MLFCCISSFITGRPRYVTLLLRIPRYVPILYVFQILKYVSRSMNLYIESLKQIKTWHTSKNKQICGWYISRTTCTSRAIPGANGSVPTVGSKYNCISRDLFKSSGCLLLDVQPSYENQLFPTLCTSDGNLTLSFLWLLLMVAILSNFHVLPLQ